MNYDPNLTCSGRFANQLVRLTFGQWDYRATFEQVVGGNCTGMTVIESAVSQVHDGLPGEDCARIILTRENGDELECEDEEERGEDWLADMLIAAEIVSITPDDALKE